MDFLKRKMRGSDAEKERAAIEQMVIEYKEDVANADKLLKHMKTVWDALQKATQ